MMIVLSHPAIRAVKVCLVIFALPPLTARADLPRPVKAFIKSYCFDCHDAKTHKAGQNLEKLPSDLNDPAVFGTWVKVHDKIRSGKMPPPEAERPPKAETAATLRELDQALIVADRARQQEGRAVFRRLNRTEYENTLRDLLVLPGLSVRDLLPEDGRALGFDKTGTALDLSFVQLNKYLEAADAALDLAIAPIADKPNRYHKRLYPAGEWSFGNLLKFGDGVFLKDFKYDASTYPVIHDGASAIVAQNRLTEIYESYDGAVGVFRHTDHDLQLSFNRRFAAHYSGRYRLKFSVWGFQWDKGQVKPARGNEVVGVLASGRILGYFDAPSLKPTVHELEVWLNKKETIEFNAASLWPIVSAAALPNSTAGFTAPGIAFDWLEIDGPVNDTWPPDSHRRLFGDLPLGPYGTGETRPPRRTALAEHWFWPKERENDPVYALATVASKQPTTDAERLLTDFLPRAFRRPVPPEEVRRYTGIVKDRLAAKDSFEEAMRTACKAALCSTRFLYLQETPGQLDDWALASRLSYLLWGSMPDDELFAVARRSKLRDPKELHKQVERLLGDAKAERFVDDFLDQWLDLRDINQTTPDSVLYPEFSTFLRDSMLSESRAYFRELINNNLGFACVVQSDFAMLNQRLAELYGIPGISGASVHRVPLPANTHRGGFLTQASVLKVTANGTSTTPVKRGAWVQRKILDQPPEPPPANVPAIEPDIRGATTIREQLARHRSIEACASCHAQIDPPGFALESYDVIGGWRQRYRSLEQGDPVPNKFASLGTPVAYRNGQAVDPSGVLRDGRAFADIEQFKKLLLKDERQLARSFVRQLVIYATGAPVGYADRPAVEKILDRTQAGHYGLRSLIHEVVQSSLFQNK